MARQARSKSDFLEHFNDCEGSKLISEVENNEGGVMKTLRVTVRALKLCV